MVVANPMFATGLMSLMGTPGPCITLPLRGLCDTVPQRGLCVNVPLRGLCLLHSVQATQHVGRAVVRHLAAPHLFVGTQPRAILILTCKRKRRGMAYVYGRRK